MALIHLSQIDGGSQIQDDITLLKSSTTFSQLNPSSVWTITHNLNKFPAVAVVDSAGSLVVGDVDYLDPNTISVTFSAPFGGIAYLN